jgi:crotonobetainyl-CoA:carnitine CoA-transferase CaiB-like acyl-CoA transferase
MEIQMDHELTGDAGMKMIGNPIQYSETPVDYRHPPPMLGQHSHEILKDWLNLEDSEIDGLSEKKVL